MTEQEDTLSRGNPAEDLRACLTTLDGLDLAKVLPQVSLDVLEFLALGGKMARLMLQVEASSRRLDALPLRDPESLEDAAVVRNSASRATEEMAQALSLLCAGLQGNLEDAEALNHGFREHLHAFNNLLVGINCYADLLRAKLQPGDPCYEDLAAICEKSAAISKVVHQRTLIRRYLDYLSMAEEEERNTLERKTLMLLAESLGAQARIDDHGEAALDPSKVDHALTTLLPTEQQVLREIQRRLTLEKI